MKRLYSLKGRKLFKDVYTKGKRYQSRGIRLYTYKCTQTEIGAQSKKHPVRIGFSVGKRLGNACIRNLIKRRMRSICQELLEKMNNNMCIILQPGPVVLNRKYDVLKEDVQALLVKSGVVTGD